MNPPNDIEQFEVSGEEIQALIYDRLMPAVEGQPVPNAFLGMLTLCALILNKDVSLEELKNVVQSTSEYMVTAMTPTATGSIN